MPKFRKKPVVIEAIQWTGENLDNIRDLSVYDAVVRMINGDLVIITLEGEMRASLGDWIVRGVQGELYPCKPDIFAATYEEV